MRPIRRTFIITEPKKMYIRKNRRRKYALKAALQQAEEERKAMVIVPWPKEVVFPGCFAEVSTLADLEVQKFFYHIPHYRVIQQYKEAGVMVSSSTINDWHNRTCDLLHPLYNALRRHLMKSPYREGCTITIVFFGLLTDKISFVDFFQPICKDFLKIGSAICCLFRTYYQ